MRKAFVVGSAWLPACKPGLRALRSADVGHVHRDLRGEFEESVALDETDPETRWDYLMSQRKTGALVALEVHPATSGEIDRVIAKKRAAVDLLRGELRPDVSVRRWAWAASGSTAFTPFEAAKLRLDRAGIAFVGRVLLPKHLDDLAPRAPTKRKRR